MQQPIAIILPLEDEFTPYRSQLGTLAKVSGTGPWEVFEATLSSQRILLIISDCGPACAAAAAEFVIAKFNPSMILHGGSAGGLTEELLPGDVVIGDEYVILASKETKDSRLKLGLHPSLMRFRKDSKRTYFDSLPADRRLLSVAKMVAPEVEPELQKWSGPGMKGDMRDARCVVGRIASADMWTTSIDEIKRLHTEYGALSEDMESSYIALICALHDVPFLAIRAISDSQFHHDLAPADVKHALAEAGKVSATLVARVIQHVIAN